MKQQGTHLNNDCSIIGACCIVHNYCIVHADKAEDNWLVEDEEAGHPTDAAAPPVIAGGAGAVVRNALMGLCWCQTTHGSQS